MAKHVMRRSAADNEYLHKDFHGALSAGLEYLHDQYGEAAVREYLWQFGRTFYAPVTEAIRQRGLAALEEHFQKVYDVEGGEVRFIRSEDELRIDVNACPAVTHMRRQGYAVARLYHETLASVGKAICHGTDFEAELVEYDSQTGRSVRRFVRRSS